MQIAVIDGQGGGIGKAIIEKLRAELPEAEIIAVGTNAAATGNMMKGRANAGATGENAVIYNCAHADVIVGPLGIILPNAMMGEITARMAAAVTAGNARRVFLVPASKKHVNIAGLEEKPLAQYIEEAVSRIRAFCGK